MMVAAAGCGGAVRNTHCATGFIGDSSQAVEVQMLFTDGKSMVLMPVADGDELPMEPPPQGGEVLYVGAAANNVDGCNIELRGRLLDPVTHDQLGLDARDTNLILRSDGWGESDASDDSNEANVNACPDYSSSDRVDGTFILEMTVTDRGGRTATVSHSVKLICDPTLDSAAYANCVCTCSANYKLGICNGFTLDGGV